jgi:hypothetical protein
LPESGRSSAEEKKTPSRWNSLLAKRWLGQFAGRLAAMNGLRIVACAGLLFLAAGLLTPPSVAAQYSQPGVDSAPPIPPAPGARVDDSEFYGVGYVAPWQPVSGVHWRKGARLEYYTRPPAPTWRWFTTGRGCGYDKGIVYGVGYPQIPTPNYGK